MAKTPDTIVNEIAMARQVRAVTFVLAEGDFDSRIYASHLRGEVQVIVTEGRQNLNDALEILEIEGADDVLGITDADFALVNGAPVDQNRLLYTDGHDVEAMLLHSPALDKVAREYGSRAKLETFLGSGRDLRNSLYEAVAPLSALRLLNDRSGTGLDFNDLAFDKFLPRSTLIVNRPHLVKEVLDKSRQRSALATDILHGIDEILAEGIPVNLIGVGEDVVQAFAISLRRMIGSAAALEVTKPALYRAFALAYESEWFRQTGLARRIRAWEARTGRRILD